MADIGEGSSSSTIPPDYPASTTHAFGTPEPVDALSHPVAGWWHRVGAQLIDMLVVWVPGSIVLGLVYVATSTPIADANGSTHTLHPYFDLGLAVIGAAQLIYFGTLDGQNQTVGKRALGIAVRSRASGHPIGFTRALVRQFVFGILWDLVFLPGLLNALWPLWDRQHQAWHDHAVGSVVVKMR